MVKSETRRDAEILVRNPSPRLFGEKFRDSKKVKTNHEKTRLRDLSKTFPRFRDRAKIFRDPRFSRYHSPPLLFCSFTAINHNKNKTKENRYQTSLNSFCPEMPLHIQHNYCMHVIFFMIFNIIFCFWFKEILWGISSIWQGVIWTWQSWISYNRTSHGRLCCVDNRTEGSV